MKNIKWIVVFFLSILIIPVVLISQETEKRPERPVSDMFGSTWLIDNQTVLVQIKGTFEFDIQHRFGTLDRGYDDFWGLFSDGNFRLGFNYVPVQNLQLGFGFTKDNLLWDFHAKYAILTQTRSGSTPLSISYLANMAMDTRDKDKTIFRKTGDRLSYFHQLMVARKFSDAFSVQLSANYIHFNYINGILENNTPIAERKNNHISASLLTKIKLTEGKNFIANIDLPFTDHKPDNPETNITNPKANISFGIEFVTSSHAFQLFIGNYRTLVPQYNHMFNRNDFSSEGLLIGFNMTRLWNF